MKKLLIIAGVAFGYVVLIQLVNYYKTFGSGLKWLLPCGYPGLNSVYTAGFNVGAPSSS
jgi:hypothetical protein